MTKAELVDEVGREASLTRKHSEVIVDAVFSSIVEALQRGDKIELRGFGSFRIRRRGTRTGPIRLLHRGQYRHQGWNRRYHRQYLRPGPLENQEEADD